MELGPDEFAFLTWNLGSAILRGVMGATFEGCVIATAQNSFVTQMKELRPSANLNYSKSLYRPNVIAFPLRFSMHLSGVRFCFVSRSSESGLPHRPLADISYLPLLDSQRQTAERDHRPGRRELAGSRRPWIPGLSILSGW
jgi:hypothetical protein